jgi:hypothetical protein
MVDFQPLTPFEKCMITKLQCNTKISQGHTEVLVGIAKPRVGQITNEWRPRCLGCGFKLPYHHSGKKEEDSSI